ncbi:MAG: hypothetical protein EOM20_16615 [Spartobacteria bacterium]|nr:hypothetical protein [Spartobacteria bacterium]
MRHRKLPLPGQFLIPRGNRLYAMQVVSYQDDGSVLCHRWDVDDNKRPTKQTAFGKEYFISRLNPLPLGAIGELFKWGGEGKYDGAAFDIYGVGQLDLFSATSNDSMRVSE